MWIAVIDRLSLIQFDHGLLFVVHVPLLGVQFANLVVELHAVMLIHLFVDVNHHKLVELLQFPELELLFVLLKCVDERRQVPDVLDCLV